LTVESSLDKMRRLMLQLREGATPAGGARGVGLSAIVRRVQRDASTAGRRLELEIVDELSTRGHEDRLERVLGHLVQYIRELGGSLAVDSAPGKGTVIRVLLPLFDAGPAGGDLAGVPGR